MKTWKAFVMVIIIVLLGTSFHINAIAGGPKSFAGVVWDKEGNVVMIDAGIEYVNQDAFECLDPKYFFKHAQKIDLNVDCFDWKHEKKLDSKDLKVLSSTEIAKKEILTKMSSEERFRAALSASGVSGKDQENYILVAERAVYPDTKSKGVTYWYTFVLKEHWKCKDKN